MGRDAEYFHNLVVLAGILEEVFRDQRANISAAASPGALVSNNRCTRSRSDAPVRCVCAAPAPTACYLIRRLPRSAKSMRTTSPLARRTLMGC